MLLYHAGNCISASTDCLACSDKGKLSRAADVDMNTLRRVYDDTKYSPTLATLEKLAKALGVKIADLIEEDDAQQ